jgi:bifunctional UDP-N-acetylglucosamine pyrophosphorylase/glucosamine-1-phosphate N-acetyltransferase
VAAVYQPEPCDFGRVYDDNSYFIQIVEARDIKPSHGQTDWANTGIYMFKGAELLVALGKLTNNNSQNEYYLTDAPKIISENDKLVQVFHSRESMSVFTGINTQIHLAEATAHMRARVNERHMLGGVRMLAPESVFIDSTVEITRGVTIYPNVILEGSCKIGENAVVGMNSHLTNVSLGAGAVIRQSVATDAKIGANTEVGPFAYLRPGTVIGEKCRIGNFVEVKNANLANGVKMAHLAYIGDADVGENVNYSCGAITANYDGTNKHRTKIGDNAFIGSNANLVAPVEIGADSFVAAGSTITDSLPPCALGIARERQCTKLNRIKPHES